MYLSTLTLSNFRCFDENKHIIPFNNGLTVLVGENDSGKSAIMDAIRIVLGTTDLSWNKIDRTDFYQEDISKEISIVCKFEELMPEECAAFLECLTYEKKEDKRVPVLYLYWKGKYLTSFNPPRPTTSLATGKDGNGPTPSSEARELLRVTYLRALRDAYTDMQSGRHSRLSQIMQHVANMDQGTNGYVEAMDLSQLSIVGIVNLANELLAKHKALAEVTESMTKILSEQMLLTGDKIKTHFDVAGTTLTNVQKQMQLLEKLDLSVSQDDFHMSGKVGLGTSNILSMACELLLNAEDKGKSSFLLIEEPEAHIHAQRQLKLIQSLEKSAEEGNQQIIMTTHSPLLASVIKLNNLLIVKSGKVFPLSASHTMLSTNDYLFLEKYLDATKANLFFARNVIIVEGPGEALLLPTLSKLIGFNFTDNGVSLVDVRGTGLSRYAKIFQRKDETNLLDVRVSCITDRDIMPNCAPAICIDEKYSDLTKWPPKNKRQWRAEKDFVSAMANPTNDEEKTIQQHVKDICNRADGQNVKTFVADNWTLEYDLAYYGLQNEIMSEKLIDSVINVSYAEANRATKKTELENQIAKADTVEEKASIFYSYFTSKKASKADFAQYFSVSLEKKTILDGSRLEKALPPYLVKAIKYAVKGI